MAITSPALVLANAALFGNIKPVLDGLKKLGPTDFAAGAPEFVAKPGATIKVPVSSIAAASAFNASSNNYLTGGSTDWASLTSTHYLQGFDISGVNIDEGCEQGRMEQLFASRAGSGIAAAIQGALKSTLDGCTTSTGVTLSTPTLADYMALATAKDWYDGNLCVLAVNGTTLADIKAKFAAVHVIGTNTELAQFMGFKDMVLVPGMTANAAIVPEGALGFMGRVPTIIANYPQSGTETDPDSGLSVGIVVADDQATNKRVVNADMWFGAYAISANAAATTAGIIKIS